LLIVSLRVESSSRCLHLLGEVVDRSLDLSCSYHAHQTWKGCD